MWGFKNGQSECDPVDRLDEGIVGMWIVKKFNSGGFAF